MRSGAATAGQAKRATKKEATSSHANKIPRTAPASSGKIAEHLCDPNGEQRRRRVHTDEEERQRRGRQPKAFGARKPTRDGRHYDFHDAILTRPMRSSDNT